MPVTGTVLELLRTRWEEDGRPPAAWIFPTNDQMRSYPADMLDDHLRLAEEVAGLEPLVDTLWHAYRRKWIAERKDLPLNDTMQAGGWSDVQTAMTRHHPPENDKTPHGT